MTAAAMFLFGTVFGLLGCAWMLAPERRRLRQRCHREIARADAWAWAAETARNERDRNRRLYDQKSAEVTALTELVTPEQLAAAKRSLADNPGYFTVQAAAEIAALDELWEIS
jgi:hypothetical protein